MSEPFVLLDNQKHADVKFSAPKYAHVADQHLLPVSLHELLYAAVDVPVVFIKNNETGEFQAVMMLGLKPNQNLLVKGEEWLGNYIPNVLRDFPLTVVLNPEQKDKVWIGVRESSDQVNKAEGEALFADGEETEFLKNRREALLKHFEQDQQSRAILGYLASKNLLIAQTLTVEVKGEQRNINGIYLIDERKLAEMSDEDFLDLRKRGLLGPIYSHLTSLNQIPRLVQFEAAL
ncbi:SapC family protein [Shewanella yunxiaonensis]|uniref:SapC family protein n=1 Tax=Shewanella yunxiaonensis TaxID=2829809 RepID=A0ABX7YVG1_9GAMM|nr:MULTISPECIES: SapC family protein [Shewanella]MDF0532780.1 SapC family protein [Shewanella sp. A32]QUN06667.1 SapC family protein [Shewanella yunxiaonensis]